MSHFLQKQNARIQELALVDHPSGLLPWELRFCQEYACRGQLIEAMQQACAVHELGNDHSLRMKAVAMLRKPAVKRYMRHLQDRLEDMGVASMLEVQTFLSDAIRTPLAMITDEDPLCQKKTSIITRHKDGTETERVMIESISKMDAAKTLSKMKGWDAPIRVDVNHSGGVMVVPMTENLTDWEKAAGESQAKLMADAIDI